MGNDAYIWEMAKICGKWLKYLTNGFINWEMRFGRWLNYFGNGLNTWFTALVFENRLYYV